MQQIGAVAVKHAVYVLPDSPDSREDFEWLKAEIEGAGGEATVFAADSVDAWSDDALIEQFRQLRQQAYEKLAREAAKALPRIGAPARSAKARSPRRVVEQLSERLAAIERVDFFASAGRDRVVTLLHQLQDAAGLNRHGPKSGEAKGLKGAYTDRLWVTRPRPGVDRMASAWLIRRFVDPAARFGFVADRDSAPADAIPFDMFGVEFTHHGERCTFETLCERFALDDSALSAVASIVHDLDLKDRRFSPPEAPAIGVVIEGLRLTYADDDVLLAEGIKLFDALYRAFAQSARRTGPRPVSRSRRRSKRAGRHRAAGRDGQP